MFTVMASIPFGMEMADELAVSSVLADSVAFLDRRRENFIVQALHRREIGGHVRLGRDQLERHQALEIMACPVVPVGISDVATTAEVLTGRLRRWRVCILPRPLHTGVSDRAAATNRITPIRTNISVCFFTEPFPLSSDQRRAATRHASFWRSAPLEGTTADGERT